MNPNATLVFLCCKNSTKQSEITKGTHLYQVMPYVFFLVPSLLLKNNKEVVLKILIDLV
jgi:hypothetical protein